MIVGVYMHRDRLVARGLRLIVQRVREDDYQVTLVSPSGGRAV